MKIVNEINTGIASVASVTVGSVVVEFDAFDEAILSALCRNFSVVMSRFEESFSGKFMEHLKEKALRPYNKLMELAAYVKVATDADDKAVFGAMMVAIDDVMTKRFSLYRDQAVRENDGRVEYQYESFCSEAEYLFVRALGDVTVTTVLDVIKNC